VVVRSVLGDQSNPSISSFKRGNFRLGELNPNFRLNYCMLVILIFFVP